MRLHPYKELFQGLICLFGGGHGGEGSPFSWSRGELVLGGLPSIAFGPFARGSINVRCPKKKVRNLEIGPRRQSGKSKDIGKKTLAQGLRMREDRSKRPHTGQRSKFAGAST